MFRDMSVPRSAESVRRRWTWKLVSTLTGALFSLIANKLLRLAYRKVRKQNPDIAFDPTAKRFSWSDAVVWAMAAGVGLVAAKMVSDRIAAIGWQAATGGLPPTSTSQSAA
jgi:hypothetical protein